MKPNVAEMRVQRFNAVELLDSAIEIICEAPDDSLPADQVEFRHATVNSYLALVRHAVERFEEAANGG
jgi:hypothetical protein